MLYWADGKMIPLEKLGDKELYWSLMYRYAKDIPDPATFSQEDIQRLRNFLRRKTVHGKPSYRSTFLICIRQCNAPIDGSSYKKRRLSR